MSAVRYSVAIGVLTWGLIPQVTAQPDEDPLSGVYSLTPERLVEAVLARNPGLQALDATARQAAFRIEPASALDDPTLSYVLAPGTLDGRVEQGIELSQSLPWPGTLDFREDVARSEATAADQALLDLRLEVVARTQAAFAEWYYVHRALAINEGDQALLIELQNVAETRYATGRATLQDVLQAELEQARLQQQALALERTLRSVQARLNGMLNRSPARPLPPPCELPEPAILPSPEVLRQAALTSHPELARLQAMVASSRARESLAAKAFYPDFRVSAGYNNLWDQEEKRFTVGASISIPLNQGKRRAALDAARAASSRTRWQLLDRRAQLLAEVESARAAVVEAADGVALHQNQLLPLARQNLAAAEADYRAGAGSFLNVVTAEKQKLATELGLERARADYVRRLAVLRRWTGGSLIALEGESP